MTNEEILQTFSDINHAYNNSTKYDTLKRMLDELTEPCEDCISREEAIKETKKLLRGNYDPEYIVEILKMLPPVTPQAPCEDCISREATIEAIYKKYIGGKDAIKNAPINDLYADGLAEAVDAVWDMPSVTPTRPAGKWIDIGDEGLVFKCSLCGDKNTIESHYCPNCGARMEAETKIEHGLNYSDQNTMMSAT